jgi:hypothetical protein
LNPKTIFEELESSFEALKSRFEALETEFDALESIFEVGFVFSVFSGSVWPEMENVAGDELAGDSG